MQLFGMEKLSLVDFDGKIAATIFTGGCNFRCGFCHNSPLVLHVDKLPEYSLKEVFDYLEKRKGILEGVCVSGGEPTLNPDLDVLLKDIKNLGYPIKLDTNGTNPYKLKSLVENGLIDYVAMDVKNDKKAYGEIIGIPNYDTKKVEQSVDFLLSGAIPYEFRTTLIKEFHTIENIRLIGEWIKGADKYFLQKFKDSENCIQSHLSPVDEKTVLEFKDALSSCVPNTFLRGYDL